MESQELKELSSQRQKDKIRNDKARAAELGISLAEYYLFLLVEYKYLNRI